MHATVTPKTTNFSLQYLLGLYVKGPCLRVTREAMEAPLLTPVRGRAMELAVRELPSTPSSIQRYLQDIGFEIELPKAQLAGAATAHGPAPPPGGTSSFYAPPDDEGSSVISASVTKRAAVTAVATKRAEVIAVATEAIKTRLGSESVVAARKGLYLRIPDRSMDTGIPQNSRSLQVPTPEVVEWRGRLLGNKGPLQPQLFSVAPQRYGTTSGGATMDSITLDTLGVNAALLRVKPPPPTISVEQFKARLCDAVQAPLPQVPSRSGSSTLAGSQQKHEGSAQAYLRQSSKEHSKEHRIDVARSIHAAKVARSIVGTGGVLKPPPIRPPRRFDPPWRLDPLTCSPRTTEVTNLDEAPAPAMPLQPGPEHHSARHSAISATSSSTTSCRSVITLHMQAPPIHDPITMFPKVHFSENMELEAWKQLPLNFHIARSQYAPP